MFGKTHLLQRPHAASRKSACGRVLVSACVLLYALCLPAYAAPHPAWPKEFVVNGAKTNGVSTVRYTFVLPKRHPYCLVELPSRQPDGSFPEGFAVHFGSKWLNTHIAHVGDEKTVVLIDATQALGGDTLEIYPVGSSDAPPSDSNALRAPQPISCEFRRSRFDSDVLPQDVLFSTQAGILRRTGPERFMSRNFEAVNAQIRNSRHERRGSPFTDGIADIVTWVFIDTPGTYIFAIRGRGASSLAIGPEERIIASAYTPYPVNHRQPQEDEPKWSLGTELDLQPGVYRLHAQNYHYYDPAVSIGWLRPGSGDVEEIPPDVLLSGQATIPFLRTEFRDAPLVVGFRTRLTNPYAFAGQTNVFTTCTATTRTALWAPAPETPDPDPPPPFEWAIDGTSYPCTNASLVAILPNGSHEVVVTAHMAGFTAASTNIVHIHGLPENEYRIDADLTGIAPFLRDDDILRPDLWITGDFPAPISVDATLSVRLRDGTSQDYAAPISLVKNWARLEGAPLPVSEVDAISWSLRHGGVELSSDTLVLQRPPFGTSPVSIIGSTLRLPDGHAVSYVLPRTPSASASVSQSIDSSDPAAEDSPVFLIDDFLLAPAADTNATEALRLAFGDSVIHVPAGTLRHDDGEALSPAAILCGLDTIPEHSTVVLCLGMEAIFQRRPAEDYEREILAAATLLRDARHADVVIATPPPFEGFPVPIRPYASAALRAAAICGLPAADLYSAFQTRPRDGAALVDGVRITPAGFRRASETILRLLDGRP